VAVLQPSIPTFGKHKPHLGREEHFQEAATGLIKYKYKELNYFHVPNEGKRRNGGKYVRQGLTAGVSDIIILTPNKNYHGLAIELKTKKGRCTDHQKKFLIRCMENGYYACVCYSMDALQEIIDNYISNNL
tara:strand:- start:1824 stop:2216 length:393 start_codon:yes stop_codon:yes gene_type:complete